MIDENRPAIVGLDLHWHFQSYDVIEVARKIKLKHPEVAVLLGGFTASVFAEEIVRDYPFIDFVIRGDAEIPILHLVRRFGRDKDLRSVPNLTYRENGSPVSNACSYAADGAMLDSLCFTDFTLMKDFPSFVRAFSRYVRMTGYSEALQRRILGKRSTFPVVIGRGCAYECSFCGGSHEAHGLMAGRRTIALRSPNSVVASLSDLQRFGFDTAGLCHDCCPSEEGDQYYIAIFEQLKQLKCPLSLQVERYSLPGRGFLESFAGLPGKRSSIALSIHSHSEQLRRKNGVHRYSNGALEEMLAIADSLGVHVELYFACGLPFESVQDLKGMAVYQESLHKKFKHLRTRTALIEIEPASPMSRQPDAYGLTLERATFAEFYRYHSQPANNHFQETGYVRCGLPGRDELRRFYCRHFCERIRAGAASPYICSLIELSRHLGVLSALDQVVSLK